MNKITILPLITSAIFASSSIFAQISSSDKDALGVKSYEEILLFDKSLTEQGSDNVAIWRIPSLLRTKDGVLIAAVDKRWQHRGDWGDIDTAIRLSYDDGKTWGKITTILDLPSNNGDKSPAPLDPVKFNAWGDRADCTIYCNSAFLIDVQMVQDKRNGRVFLAVDMFSDGPGFFGVKESGNGQIKIDEKDYLILRRQNEMWTLREDGEVFNEKNERTNYRVIINGDPNKAFKDLGDIYDGEEKIGNIYVKNNSTPFLAVNTANVWLTHSDDNGKTWANPVNLSAQVKKDWMRFFGTGPSVGIQTKNGNLIFPVYYTNQNGKQSSALVISKDGGKTWDLGKSPNDNRPELWGKTSIDLNTSSPGQELTESQLAELENGDLKLFMRNTSGRVMMSTSKDGGYTWLKTEKVEDLKHGYSQVSIIKYSKKINGKEYLIFAGQSKEGGGGDHLRRDGKLFLGEVQEDGSIKWDTVNLVKEIESTGKSETNKIYENGFVYSSIAELGDGSIGLAYENTVDYTSIMYFPIEMQEFFWRAGKIFSDIRQKEPIIFTYLDPNNIEKIGDGVAIKRGKGESQGGATVSEGVLILSQENDDHNNNLAFTDVMLNNTGIVKVANSEQTIKILSVNEGATGHLVFDITSDNTPKLTITDAIKAKSVGVQVNLDKKLKPNTKGCYHHQGEELISFKSENNVAKLGLIGDTLIKGMYVYTLATVKQSDKRSGSSDYSVYLTNKLITEEGKAIPTLVSDSTSMVTHARPQVNPVLASYLVANITMNNISTQMQQHFTQETLSLEGKGKNIFVKSLAGKQKYGSNLSFVDYGYDFNTNYNGIMLGGKIYHSYNDTNFLYVAANKITYNVTPKAVDGKTKAIYRSWGVNANWHTKFSENIALDVLTSYQTHKGSIENVNDKLKGHTFGIDTKIGYSIPVNSEVLVIPTVGLGYQQTNLSDVQYTSNDTSLRYNKLNALKTSLGLHLHYNTEFVELRGNISYSIYSQKQGILNVDEVKYKQGKLANTFNSGALLKVNVTPTFSVSTELSLQQSRDKSQYAFAVGANYQF